MAKSKTDNRIISLIIIIILLWLLLSPEFMTFVRGLTNGGSTSYIPGNKQDPLNTYDPRKRVITDPNTLGRTNTEMG